MNHRQKRIFGGCGVTSSEQRRGNANTSAVRLLDGPQINGAIRTMAEPNMTLNLGAPKPGNPVVIDHSTIKLSGCIQCSGTVKAIRDPFPTSTVVARENSVNSGASAFDHSLQMTGRSARGQLDNENLINASTSTTY